MLQFLLAHYIDILIISESKLDGTFSSLQFLIYGFRTTYRLDRNDKRFFMRKVFLSLKYF